MKSLVTGGGGFLGLYIVEQLLKQGDEVRVVCRGDYPALQQRNVETVRGDIRDCEFLKQSFRDCEQVFHVAAIPGVWGKWKTFYETNTLGTENVIQACLANRIPKLIYTSSPSVIYDGRPHENADESLPYPASYLAHYPRSKRLAEEAVLRANGKQNLSTVALRPHLIWGPRDNHLIPRLLKRASSGRLRSVGDRSNLISMSYVENVAHAHLQAAEKLNPDAPVAGEAYFINEREPVNLWNWIDEILQLANLPPVKKNISAKAAWRIGAVLETIFQWLPASWEPPMTRFVASQLSQSHYYSIARAEQDFGYQPMVSVAEGMRLLGKEMEKSFASTQDE